MKTPLTYYGGKQNMVRHILPLIPDHETYVEPFVGGAAVFWAKQKAGVEVLNDTNQEIVNLWQVLQTQPDELAAMIAATPYSRRVYDFSLQVYKFAEFHEPVRRAWATWIQCNVSFAGKIGAGWAYDNKPNDGGQDKWALAYHAKRLSFADQDHLQAVNDRLAHVQFECRDALYVIKQRDHPSAFHYIDPPYPNTEQGSYAGYTIEHYTQLLDLLTTLEGKFMLSSFDAPLLREYATAHGWIIREFDKIGRANLAVDGKREKRNPEVLAMNYDPSTIQDLNTNQLFHTC